MIDKRLRSEIAQCELSTSVAGSLHFDSSITRFIKSGSPCRLHCLRRSYKLLRGYPPSPQMAKLTSPSQNGEGFFLLFYLLSYKKIVFYFLVKVDGQKSHVNMDKCPVNL